MTAMMLLDRPGNSAIVTLVAVVRLRAIRRSAHHDTERRAHLIIGPNVMG